MQVKTSVLLVFGRRNRSALWSFLILGAIFSVLSAKPFERLLTSSAHPEDVTTAGPPRLPEASSNIAVTNQAYGNLPISFAANEGQAHSDAKFIARGSGYGLFLTSAGAVLSLTHSLDQQKTDVAPEVRPTSAKQASAAVSLRLLESRRQPRITGRDELPGKLNYFIGNDPGKWRTDIDTYAKVHYENVYRGIDVVYYGNQRELEYDFVIAPRANPHHIKLQFRGASLSIDEETGDLILHTPQGDVRQRKPLAYQQIKHQRQEVAVAYQLEQDTVTFKIGEYDTSRQLVIDPVLIYSSFLGGANSEQGLGIAVDAQGSAYLTGATTSSDFPLAGALQSIKDAVNDAFVVKLNPAGTALIYSTYVGANGDDIGNAIAVDGNGNAYVAGLTGSGSFPATAGAYQTSKSGVIDGFVFKLNPAGTQLLYATFLGGENNDQAFGVAVDSSGRAYVVGRTDSRRLGFAPVQRHGSPIYKTTDSAAQWSASDTDLNASTVTSFVFDPNNSNIVYAGSNYGVFKTINAGGNWMATGTSQPALSAALTNALAIDPSNSSIVYAGTSSGIFKTTNAGATYTAKNTGLGSTFINALAIDPLTPNTIYAGTQLGIFKSTNGGDNWAEIKNGISGTSPRVTRVVIDPTNSAIIYIATNRGMFKSTNGGSLWTVINNGLALSGTPQITGLAIDPINPATLYASGLGTAGLVLKTVDGGLNWNVNDAGLPSSVSNLTVDPITPTRVYAGTSLAGIYKSTNGGANWTAANTGYANLFALAVVIDRNNPATIYAGSNIGNDAFIVRLNAAGELDYFTNLGGNETDEARGVAVDAGNNAYIVGSTNSPNFPLANAFQPTLSGISDAFVTQLNSSGSALNYSTFLGGSGTEQGRAIAVRGGSAYVTGVTTSQTFPVLNAFKSTLADFDTDAFVAKFNSSGMALGYSTFLGGSGIDQGLGIAVDSNDAIYVAGSTQSADFPLVAGAPQSDNGGNTDGFVTRLNPAPGNLFYSTFLGGQSTDQVNGIAVDPVGNAYVVGTTSSSNFPTVTPLQATLKVTDAFVAKISLSPDLVLSMTGSPNEINYGANITYTITVNNGGEIAAQNVKLSDTLVSGTGVISISPSQGTCSGNRFINCDLGTINPGSPVTVTLVVRPPAVTPMVNTASVSTTTSEATTANNSATLNTQVNFTDLVIKNTSALQQTPINGINTYIVTVTNKGPAAALGVTVTNNLPSATTFVSCTSSGLGLCSGSGNSRTASIPSLAVNGSFTTTFATRVNSNVAVGTVVSDTASVVSTTPDINPNNDAATATTVVKAAAPPKQNGLIACTAGAGTGTSGTNNIWLMNPDGSGLTPLTLNTPAEDVAPVWSPDGTRIAFVSRAPNAYGLYVMNADGSNISRLTDSNQDQSPTWSPDGTRIAFGGSRNSDPYGILVVNSDGTNLKRLSNGNLPSWSPDEVSIAFNGAFGFMIMNADGTNIRSIPLPGLPFGAMQFRWSPDGTKLAFTGLENGSFGRSIYTVSPDGTGLTKIPNSSGGQSPAWSPDGTKIVFYGIINAGLPTGIYTIDLAGTGLTKISGDLTEVDTPDWQTQPPNFSPLSPTYSIAGHLQNSSGTSLNSTVQITGSAATSISTDNSGNYIFRGLPSGGNFTVTPLPFGMPTSSPSNRVYNNLTANVTGADFVLTYPPIPDITGVIVNQSGSPMTGVKVGIRNVFPETDVFTDANGAYKFSNISTRTGSFILPFNTGAFANYIFDPGVITYQTPTGNNFIGREKLASISGQVRVGGAGKSGVIVSTGNPQALSTTTDANGNYTLTGVGEGVTLAVLVSTSTYPFAPSSRIVPVNGPTTGIDFDAPANQSLIYGHVGDASSLSLEGVTLTLSGGANLTAQTDSQGNYSLGPVAANLAYTLTPAKLGYSFVPAATQIPNLTSNTQTGFTAYLNSVAFYYTSANVATGEGSGSISLTVVRSGLLSDPVKVDYKTLDGSARQRTDYTTMAGTLSFAPQQQSKTIVIPLNDDAYVEGDETFSVTLVNPVNGALGDIPTATVMLQDDDTATPSINPLDNAAFFVRQQYLDFLSRVPDSGGFTYWTEQITDCGMDPICIRNRRVDVSNAFFYELEFQQTGAYVYRVYRSAFGNNQPFPNPDFDPSHPGEEKKVIAYKAFVADRSRVLGGSSLAQTQLNLANAFVLRPEFVAKYPVSLDGPAFVDAMLATIKNDIGADLASQRQALIDLYNSGGRGAVLYRLADDNTQTNPINNRAFIDAEYGRSFVATQYYGYLRRDPDMGGFLFWLGQVNSGPLRDVAKQHAMVCSFITSTEYQERFSTVVTHSNAECGP
ncbi:MAG: hypothetical protein QOD75_1688 [Blastocatellia bacterium]|jgi:uncharacterized repeat protein (TIGR01451 family)|nr:hypothetical protein [Blastocatellia bacterium]